MQGLSKCKGYIYSNMYVQVKGSSAATKCIEELIYEIKSNKGDEGFEEEFCDFIVNVVRFKYDAGGMRRW